MSEVDCRALGRRARQPLAAIAEVDLASNFLRRLSDLRVDPTLHRYLPQVGTLPGALVERLRNPGVPTGSSSTFAPLFYRWLLDLLVVVGGFDRSLLRQEPIVGRNSDGIHRGTTETPVVRGIRSTNGTTALQGWNCRLPDSVL